MQGINISNEIDFKFFILDQQREMARELQNFTQLIYL